jgi:hypothetical protein
MRGVTLALAALALSACATPSVYLLADGRLPGDDPVLNQQFEMDRTICNGDMQKANLSGVTVSGGGFAGIAAAADRAQAAGQVGVGCMAAKGYVLVPKDQVPAKQQELAAIAAEKARREAAAIAAAAPPLAPPVHRVAAAKPKPKPAPQPSPPPAQPVSQQIGQ